MELINSREESIVIIEKRLIQVKRLTKQIVLRVGMPSKYLLFLFVHKHHNIEAATKDQIFFMDFPTFQELQHTKASLTEYYGPYLMGQKIGTVAYNLKLPSISMIYLAFYVSLLKKRIVSDVTPQQ